jgi:hypothetical protein
MSYHFRQGWKSDASPCSMAEGSLMPKRLGVLAIKGNAEVSGLDDIKS